jgi:hypothetical protein
MLILLGWNSVIQVAAIDCAEARNMKTCENFSIQGYPTLKVSLYAVAVALQIEF